MKLLLSILMPLNVLVFLFGGVQHAGVAIGRFHEPVIIPAAIVEFIGAIALGAGVISLSRAGPSTWLTALIANFIALAGVLLGIVALAVGPGPRTASNDLYHRIMLILILACLLVLLFGRPALAPKPK